MLREEYCDINKMMESGLKCVVHIKHGFSFTVHNFGQPTFMLFRSGFRCVAGVFYHQSIHHCHLSCAIMMKNQLNMKHCKCNLYEENIQHNTVESR